MSFSDTISFMNFFYVKNKWKKNDEVKYNCYILVIFRYGMLWLYFGNLRKLLSASGDVT